MTVKEFNQNISHFDTKHACDTQTDRHTDR